MKCSSMLRCIGAVNWRRNKHVGRANSGSNLVEFAAALVIGLPLVMSMLYVITEVGTLFAIRTNLDSAARLAAELMITDYEKNGNMTNISNGNLPAAYAFDVSAGGSYYYVSKSANQFTCTWNTSTYPKTVTVVVSYPHGGGGGLLPFPYPDPFHLAGKFTIQTSACFSAP